MEVWKANNSSHSPDYDGGEIYSPPNRNREFPVIAG
jgi:hypothetical protein